MGLHVNMNLVAVIANHNCNLNAIALKKALLPLVDTIIIDSGSTIDDSIAGYFDIQLENVFYSGILNRAHDEMKSRRCSHLLLINSDVLIVDPGRLIDRIQTVMKITGAQLYSPSVEDKSHNHNHMVRKPDGDWHNVTFVDGFCFVASRDILDNCCPVDLKVNKIGHGVDIYMGFLAMKNKADAVVDDRLTVYHPPGSGYDSKIARTMRDAWYKNRSLPARLFHSLASEDFLKNTFGYWIIKLVLGVVLFFRLT